MTVQEKIIYKDSKDSKDIFRHLQKHLDKLPIGFPATESGVEIEILKYLFEPVEATAALCLSLFPSTPSKVQKRLGSRFDIHMSISETEDLLEKMFMKGSIRRSSGKPFKYSNAVLAIGMFENQLGHLTADFVKMMHRYLDEGFGEEFFRSSLPQLRTSPHLKAIVPEYQIDTYDNMRHFIENTDKSIQVADCVCKEGEALLGSPCKQTDNIEVCIMFDSDNYIARKQARNINREECLEILDRAEREGLVIQPGNSLEPFCICLCCGCCCGVLTTAKKMPNPASLFASNFYAELDADLCNGCGICVSRCQMDAIKLSDSLPEGEGNHERKAVLDHNRCIGCGLCVTTCSRKALSLIEKKVKTVPPVDAVSLYLKILQEKTGKMKMMGSMLNMLIR